MELHEGDIFKFYLNENSCWGPKGWHKAVVLKVNNNLYVHHLSLKMLKGRINSVCNPGIDRLSEFLKSSFIQERNGIKIIKNILN